MTENYAMDNLAETDCIWYIERQISLQPREETMVEVLVQLLQDMEDQV